jgi:hypothetical protein
LATIPNLTSLNLSQNERITNRGAASLAALSNLKALNLSNTAVTPDALRYFSDLSKLKSLALYGCRDMIDNPRVQSLQSKLPSLRCLRLNSTTNEDGVIRHQNNDDEEEVSVDSEINNDEDDLDVSYERSQLHDHDPWFQHHLGQDIEERSSVASSSGLEEMDDFEDAMGSLESEEDDGEDMEDDSIGSV